MAIITPQTHLILLKSPLEEDQQNQLTFATVSAQQDYFNSLPSITVTDFTYQRKDSSVRFPSVADNIRNYNYCMYKNAGYSDKWFYAFITDVTYVNDNLTEIKLKTDPWQTWMFDITLNTSFIEREHVADDTAGLHTLNEDVTTGEYIINSMTNKTICAPDSSGGWIALAVTELPTKNSDGQPIFSQTTARSYNGIIQGCYIILFEYSAVGTATLADVIAWYDNNAKKDAICSLYALPKDIYPAAFITPLTVADPFEGTIYRITSDTYLTSVGATAMGTTTITRNSTLDGYTPKNNKLLCYPYNYLMVTNNSGTNSIYHYEDFVTPASVEFKYSGVVTEGSNVKAYPVKYKKNSTDYVGYAYGVDMGGTPTFSWINDMYLNWKAQNTFHGTVNQAGKLMNTFYNQPTGESAGEPATALEYLGRVGEQALNYFGSVITTVKNAITGSGYQASLTPDQENGNATGDLNFSIGRTGFTYYQMSVRAEMASLIDNYFTMYGYKVNTLKSINITSRRYWNYIKCIQANITGDIPQDDLMAIKSYFNNGITFWHDTTHYLDYSQTNAIVS